MLIIGDLSGIQSYLFDVANEGGQQSRRLRARSFFIQLAAESLALRILQAAGCSQQHLIFCGAGKFIIDAPPLLLEQQLLVRDEERNLSAWLLAETNAQLRFSLTINESVGTPQQNYETAIKQLQRQKLRSWSTLAIANGAWQPSTLILKPLDSPCVICHHRSGSKSEPDEEGNMRSVCLRCYEDRKMGKELPNVKWITFNATPSANSYHLLGSNVSLLAEKPLQHSGSLIQIINHELPHDIQDQNIFQRTLARHTPDDGEGNALDFSQIASKAQGDKLLGIIKADADSLGVFLSDLLQQAPDLTPLGKFSREMDSFFGVTLDREMSKHEWDSIYTIFAGGDDLLLVGPWNVIFDFASLVHEKFAQRFGARGLTLSAGITLVKPKRPIKFAVELVEELLKEAKSQPAPTATVPKDQIAAFGQTWKWQDHAAIISNGKQLANWVDQGIAQRGWLNTLLRLAEERRQGPLAIAQANARLAYLVARNYPKEDRSNPDRPDLRRWANRLIEDFDTGNNLETIYLSTIVRYALTATRTSNLED